MPLLRRLSGNDRARSGPGRPGVSVVILDSVLGRIREGVERSSSEEGGKLLGRFERTAGGLRIKVETYIDSGPGVDSSASHLHPDGFYQEALFRVVESYDPEVEHLGSWHSHHCNGLAELSSGDVSGYAKSVNHPEYNLDFFFVLLVTALTDSGIRARYYLFRRNDERYEELDDATVSIITDTCALDSVLRKAEEASLGCRSRSGTRRLPSGMGAAGRSGQGVDSLRAIRGADQRWIARRSPSARAIRDRRDGTIYWEWSEDARVEQIDIRYGHPRTLHGAGAEHGHLEIRCRGSVLLSEDVALDESRFSVMERRLASVKSTLRTRARDDGLVGPEDGADGT